MVINVLIVGADEPCTRTLLAELDAMGCRSECAADIDRALPRLLAPDARGRPDLLILGEPAWESLALLRSYARSARLPYLPAFALKTAAEPQQDEAEPQQDEAEALADGLLGLLTVPVSTPALHEALRRFKIVRSHLAQRATAPPLQATGITLGLALALEQQGGRLLALALSALHAGQPALARRHTAQLAGSARALGAEALATLCLQLAQLPDARQPDWAPLAAMVRIELDGLIDALGKAALGAARSAPACPQPDRSGSLNALQ